MISSATGTPLPSNSCAPTLATLKGMVLTAREASPANPRLQTLRERLEPLIQISGAGHYLPGEPITNYDLGKKNNLQPEGVNATAFGEWVFARTGIRERHHAPRIPLHEIASEAGKLALRTAGVSAKDLSCIILGTTFQDKDNDSFKTALRMALNCNSETTVMVEPKACASSGFCIEQAENFIRENASANHVLIIGADQGSKITDFTDVNTGVLFGDGAGALLVSRTVGGDEANLSGVYRVVTEHYPQFSGYLYFNKSTQIEMPDGRGVFREACSAVKSSVCTLLEQTGLQVDDLDRLLLHQANTKLPRHVSKSLKIPEEKVITNIRYLGNTAAASPLILTSEAISKGLIKPGDITIMASVGMGMYSSASLIVW